LFAERKKQHAFLFSIVQIEQFHVHAPRRSSLRPNHENYSAYVEPNRHCQTFVYNADEVSLEALLDPNFRPTMSNEQEQRTTKQVYHENYQQMPQIWPRATNLTRYERASFDPKADLLPVRAPFLTIPTRRRVRHPTLFNNGNIIHL
jgi:hypothetical protein